MRYTIIYFDSLKLIYFVKTHYITACSFAINMSKSTELILYNVQIEFKYITIYEWLLFKMFKGVTHSCIISIVLLEICATSIPHSINNKEKKNSSITAKLQEFLN